MEESENKSKDYQIKVLQEENQAMRECLHNCLDMFYDEPAPPVNIIQEIEKVLGIEY